MFKAIFVSHKTVIISLLYKISAIEVTVYRKFTKIKLYL